VASLHSNILFIALPDKGYIFYKVQMFSPASYHSSGYGPHAALPFLNSHDQPFLAPPEQYNQPHLYVHNKPSNLQRTGWDGPSKRTLEPSVTGTSVLAVKYKDGVMLAADTLGSYGSLARFRDLERLHGLVKYTLFGVSGDVSDFQYISKMLEELITDDDIRDDNSSLSSKSIHSYLTRVMYERRNKFDPLWGQIIISGYRDGHSFLGLSDLRGTSYEDDTLATGYGAYIARPLMRKGYKPDLTREEAQNLLETCLRVLFYRDARSLNRVQLATITAEGPFVSKPYELSTDWSVGEIKY